MIYYVSKNGSDFNKGTKESPFLTISRAAEIAVAGDTVRVYGGIYREWVDPRNSGEENAHIVYEAVEGEKPVIKGSEIITDWERVSNTVWKRVLSNEMFEQLKDQIIYAADGTGEQKACAVSMEGSRFAKRGTSSEEPPHYLMVFSYTKHSDAMIEFLKYAFEID